MNTDHATPELFAALAASQAKLENASKSSTNPHFRSNYADLAEVLNRVRPLFAGNGLAIIQNPTFDGERVYCETVLAHAEGGWIGGTLSCVPSRSDAQGIGASVTYLRRYSLAALAGLAQEDDDGQAARHDQRPAAAAKASPPPVRKPPSGPSRRDMIEGLRESYLAAGITCGDHAAELMRKASFLKPDQPVGSMSPGDLRKAYDARALIFKTAAGPDLIIDDEPA